MWVQCKVIIASWLYILAMDGLSKLTANELKSQRARERYTALSVEEKGALVQRNPENRERKNSASTSGTEVRNSLFKEPVLHDAIKIEQNNAPGEPEVVIVEDDEVVIEPLPKKERTSNKG
uniref:Uncharacterized protein n=1 Tax=Oryza rufipogon TaxID=4529 RepID=A0A0E0Q0D2_ORYRU